MRIRNFKFKVNPTISLFTKVSSCLLSRSTPSEQPGVKQEKLLVPWITKAFQHPFKLLYKVLNLIPWQCCCKHLTNCAQGDVMLWKECWAMRVYCSFHVCLLSAIVLDRFTWTWLRWKEQGAFSIHRYSSLLPSPQCKWWTNLSRGFSVRLSVPAPGHLHEMLESILRGWALPKHMGKSSSASFCLPPLWQKTLILSL